MMKNLIWASLILLLAGCQKYPSDSVRLEDEDVVGTLYDQSTDFTQLKTYSIVDSIFYFKSEAGSNVPDTIVFEQSDQLKSLIRSNMNTRGWTEVDTSQNPDVGIDIILVSGENVGSYNYWNYYPYYWGWGGYGYWYPWYGGTVYYTYDVGTIHVDMIDLKNVDHDSEKLRVIWNSAAMGILSNTQSYNHERVRNAVNKMFEHSPYLTK
ncbi:DUF4136 domain-containing protein [bacterium SCSIO 12741]|nr:DUF4136 domain-containing protein [bacterium SCSIO 12741]